MRIGSAAASGYAVVSCLGVAVATSATAGREKDANSGDANLDLSFMLLGCVAFVMCLFYLLNWYDQDIRAYSWQILSSAICVFMGVLISSSWDQFYNVLLLGSVFNITPATAGAIWIFMSHFSVSLGWYLVLQLTLAYVSGAIGSKPKSRSHMVLNLKCFAFMFGVTNGGANVALWGFVQTLVDHYILKIGIAFLSLLYFFSLFRIAKAIRGRIASSDDGKEDEFEQLWNNFTELTEDAGITMCVAFQIVQIVRELLTGVVPLPNGALPLGVKPTIFDCHALFLCGVGFAILVPVINILLPKEKTVWFGPRRKVWAKKTASISMSFCWLYALMWRIQGYLGITGPPGFLLVALMITFFVFCLIFILDAITDLSCTGEATDREVKNMVFPLAVLIGFAWKQAFVASINTINTKVHLAPPYVQTFVMAVVLVIFVVPGWRLYILPVVMADLVQKELERDEEESQQTQKEGNTAPLLNDQSNLNRQLSKFLEEGHAPDLAANQEHMAIFCKDEHAEAADAAIGGLKRQNTKLTQQVEELKTGMDKLKDQLETTGSQASTALPLLPAAQGQSLQFIAKPAAEGFNAESAKRALGPQIPLSVAKPAVQREKRGSNSSRHEEPPSPTLSHQSFAKGPLPTSQPGNTQLQPSSVRPDAEPRPRLLSKQSAVSASNPTNRHYIRPKYTTYSQQPLNLGPTSYAVPPTTTGVTLRQASYAPYPSTNGSHSAGSQGNSVSFPVTNYTRYTRQVSPSQHA